MYVGKMNTIVNGKCPYYRSEFTKSITCEGCSGTIVQTKFESEQAKDEFIRECCFRYPNCCPLAMGNDTIVEFEEGVIYDQG